MDREREGALNGDNQATSLTPLVEERLQEGQDDERPLNRPTSGMDKVTACVKRHLPILKWLPHYTWVTFLQDLLAGFTVTLTLIPQGIAYAFVAGLPTEYGLYAGIMGGVVYFLFGSCKDITIGPTAIMALVIQNSVKVMGPDAGVLITFVSGFLVFMAGVFRLGFLVEFFSFPIISGFTTASAISIASTQLRHLLGVPGSGSTVIDAIVSVIKNIKQTRKWDAILGFTCVAALFGFKQLKVFGSLKTNPEWTTGRNVMAKFIFYLCLGANALTVIAGTTVAYVAKEYYNSTPVYITGGVKKGLPPFGIPFSTTFNGTYFGFGDMLNEYGLTIAICPMLAFLGHVAIVKAFSKGKIIDATQELIAVGLVNIAGSLVQSMPCTGSFTRTAVNNASGVRTTAGGVFTTILILVALVLLTGVFQYIPRATLAAVITVAMYYLCQFGTFMELWRTKKLDLIPYLVTLLCCLLISLEMGILIGIAVNLLFVLYSSARPKLYIEKIVVLDKTVYMVQPKTELHFVASEYLRTEVLQRCTENDSWVVIDGEFVSTVDATVGKNLTDLFEDLKIRNQTLVLLNFSDHVKQICTGQNSKLLPYFKVDTLENIVKG